MESSDNTVAIPLGIHRTHRGIHPNQKPGFAFQDARMFLQQAIQNSEVAEKWRAFFPCFLQVVYRCFCLVGWLKMDVVLLNEDCDVFLVRKIIVRYGM